MCYIRIFSDSGRIKKDLFFITSLEKPTRLWWILLIRIGQILNSEIHTRKDIHRKLEQK